MGGLSLLLVGGITTILGATHASAGTFWVGVVLAALAWVPVLVAVLGLGVEHGIRAAAGR